MAGTGEALGDLDISSPRYIAFRHNDLKVFIWYCSDKFGSKQKMIASVCNRSFQQACEDLGLTFDRKFEIRDEKEFNEAYVDELISPKEVTYGEIKVASKPKRPGRR